MKNNKKSDFLFFTQDIAMFKQYFPIFKNNPELVYLDNAASTQKPQMVIDGVSNFLAHDYANIHRGSFGAFRVALWSE